MEERRRNAKEADAKPWLKTGAVTEKRVVFRFNQLDMPPYDEWFQPCGISQTEFNELMTPVIEAMKEQKPPQNKSSPSSSPCWTRA